MWKLMGVAILTGSGLWLGLQAAGQLARRVRAIESWQCALLLLEGEMSFRLPDLPQLLEEVGRRAPDPAGMALSAAAQGFAKLGEVPFSEIWAGALAERRAALEGEELELLYRLGTILGRCGWEEQRAAAERTRLALERGAARLREELNRKGRAYGVTGLSLGAFLSILLL